MTQSEAQPQPMEPAWGHTDRMPIAVDRGAGEQRGRTRRGTAGDPLVAAFLSVDTEPIHNLLLDHLFGRWLTNADFGP